MPDRNGGRYAMILGLACLAVGSAIGQTEPPTTSPAEEPDAANSALIDVLQNEDNGPLSPWTPTEELIEFNRGIAAFRADLIEDAIRSFRGILARDPGNPVAVFYLALSYLKAGLDQYGSDSLADRESAQQFFSAAREQLELLAGTDDPRLRSLRVVETALILGIAQLAAEKPQNLEDPAKRQAFVDRTEEAQRTFARYVETEFGRNDRYGFFYLGVVHFRLGDHYDKLNDRVHSREYFQLAEEAFSQARGLADVDLRRGESDVDAQRAMTPEEFSRFDTTIKYYTALISLYQRQNDRARALLEEVITTEAGSRVAINAEIVLEALKERKGGGVQRIEFDTPFGALEFEGAIELGVGYDTNVILLGKDTQLPAGLKQKDDFTLDLVSEFSVSRFFEQDEVPLGESLTVGVGGAVAYGYRPNITEFDVNLYAGRAFVNWQPIPDLYLGLEYEYSFTQLGHKPFISSNRISPVLSKIWRRGGEGGDEWGRTDAWYTYDYRNYLERVSSREFNRDGKYHSIGARQVFYIARARDLYPEYYAEKTDLPTFFPDRWLEASIGYVYRDERTRGTEFDLWGHSLLAGLAVPMPCRWTFLFSTSLTWEHYNAPSAFDYRRNERRDFAQRYEFWLRRTLVARGENAELPTLEVDLQAGVSLTFQNSNIWDRLGQDIYEYDRAIYGLRLRVKF